MKNDVVRWSGNKAQQHCNTSLQVTALRLTHSKQHAANSPSTQQQQQQQPEDKAHSNMLLFKANNNTNFKCDNSYLVQSLTNNFATTCQQRHTAAAAASSRIPFKKFCCTKKSSPPPAFKRTFHSGCYKYSKSWQHYLIFSVVLVFLCSFNIGFVFADDVDSTFNELPYALDYEADESESPSDHYTHTWAVHIPNGDKNDSLVRQVAMDHGFVYLGKIFDDHFHFAHHKVSKRSLNPANEHQTRLDLDERIHWSKQQTAKSRRKRDFIRMRPSRTSSRALSQIDAVSFSDPKWPQMWYLNRGGDLDMNVIPAWKEGITGKGIVVTILDDGLETNHPDIEHNYDPKASYDVNNHDDDPMPHYDMTDSNRHGTRCAGEVAATANNSICAVGIAYGASVGGVRMLDGDVTDAVEARSLSLNPQHIDIYSASWGPDDDGKTVDGPGELASRAFIEGVTKGRNGKGSIFIWASGNGGREMDNCNCDGYTNSIWTLSISSATEEGHVPWYSEKCSSTLATTYSSGGQTERQVVTTDLHHTCTVSHTGTSASAPLAAGIAALVLEANQNLTWRDLQHIVVRTAKPANLIDPNWSRNGVGRRISHSFGYGLMDAAAMVRLARNWKTVPLQQRCEINAPHVDKVIPSKGYITLQLTVQHCLSVNYLEHVQAKITLTSQRRGDIQLYLRSPAGTRVTLLTSRAHDVSRSGFTQWPFMSVHTWGESPHGDWQLEIHNEGRYKAQITEWSLMFYGTESTAQPDDAKHHFNYPEMETNDIEGSQARPYNNPRPVADSSMMSNDRTNTACLKTTIDQKCLACASPTYFLAGRCYAECPSQMYSIISEINKIDNNDLNENPNSEYKSTAEELLQSMDRRKREIPLEDDLYALRTCGLCDSSCMRCHGPTNSECSACYPGNQLRKQNSKETYCFVIAERSSGNSHDDDAANNGTHPTAYNQSVLFALPVLVVIILCIILGVFWKERIPWRSTQSSWTENYTYDALISQEEATENICTQNTNVKHNNVDEEEQEKNSSSSEEDIFNITRE